MVELYGYWRSSASYRIWLNNTLHDHGEYLPLHPTLEVGNAAPLLLA
jgi:hypothetical protein